MVGLAKGDGIGAGIGSDSGDCFGFPSSDSRRSSRFPLIAGDGVNRLRADSRLLPFKLNPLELVDET